MNTRAIALLRPRDARVLAEHVDAPLVDVLDDGSVLYRTLMSYVPMTFDGLIARAWLTGFGDDLPLVHHDPRGVLFYPDVLRVRSRTYDDVVREVGYAGVWVPARVLSDDEQHEQHVALTRDIKRVSSLPPRLFR